jgi:hypothetical protein
MEWILTAMGIVIALTGVAFGILWYALKQD